MHTNEENDTASEPDSALAIRPTTLADGAKIWRLVDDCAVLDSNSCYAYLLLARDFGETSLVATMADEVVGFVAAYIPPARPEVIFVWQIGVAPAGRQQGLAKRLLAALVDLPSCRDVRYLEATITPTNTASRRLFRALADDLPADFNVLPGFESKDFGSAEHESEDLIRIGPLSEKL